MSFSFFDSPCNDPAYNLALEEFMFNTRPAGETVFLLWQNDNTIVVGKFQNTAAEINASFVEENHIKVVRRLSGGGAVYHDMGNLNFTFISDDNNEGSLDFSVFCAPVIRALARLGVKAEVSGRNDMLIDGRKFSGNSQYAKNGRVMHHGCIMFDSDLTMVSKALNVGELKYESKATKSVRSRVTTIKEHMSADKTLADFKAALIEEVLKDRDPLMLSLSENDQSAIESLKTRYDSWEWTYGRSPKYEVIKKARIEGVGTLAISLNITGGCLSDAALSGDFFSHDEPAPLCEALIGCRLDKEALLKALDGIAVSNYCRNLTADELVRLILS